MEPIAETADLEGQSIIVIDKHDDAWYPRSRHGWHRRSWPARRVESMCSPRGIRSCHPTQGTMLRSSATTRSIGSKSWSPSRSKPLPATHVQGGMKTQLVLPPTLHSSHSGLCWEIPQHPTPTSRSTMGTRFCSTGSWEVSVRTLTLYCSTAVCWWVLCERCQQREPQALWLRCSSDGGVSVFSFECGGRTYSICGHRQLCQTKVWVAGNDADWLEFRYSEIPTTGSTSSALAPQFLALGSQCHILVQTIKSVRENRARVEGPGRRSSSLSWQQFMRWGGEEEWHSSYQPGRACCSSWHSCVRSSDIPVKIIVLEELFGIST